MRGRSGLRSTQSRALCRGGPRAGHAAPGLAAPSIVPLRSVSACVVPFASAACGLAPLEGRRSQACRCSRVRRPSESDNEARDRLGVPPQRHPGGVGDPLTRTPLRRACRPQRPSSPLIAHAHRDQPRRTQGTTARRPARSRRRGAGRLRHPPWRERPRRRRSAHLPLLAVGLVELVRRTALLD